jgi:hypothetical protein
MKLPRMMTRRWMIVVAVAGVHLCVLVRLFPPRRDDPARMVLRSNYTLKVSIAGLDMPPLLIAGLGIAFLVGIVAAFARVVRGGRPST